MSKNGKNRPSILNWMGTLILLGIPGVNLIFLILSIIFAKTGAKRNRASFYFQSGITFITAVFW